MRMERNLWDVLEESQVGVSEAYRVEGRERTMTQIEIIILG